MIFRDDVESLLKTLERIADALEKIADEPENERKREFAANRALGPF